MIAAGATVVALMAGGVAAAQDWRLAPTYGTANLTSGFTPDPHYVNLESGGSIDASGLGSGCLGFIANAPDYRVNYVAGSFPRLIFSVNSSSDTTLVINGPDGRWYCNDDGGQGLNPSITFNSPASGQYDVWVGTYGSASLRPATLNVSELYSQ
jgi:hypothetical protein